MNLLITGGAGYIGSHIVNQIVRNQKTNKLIVYDNLSTGFADAIPKDVELAIADVRDTVSLRKTIIDNEIDTVIHLAGKLNVAESVENPDEYFDHNINGTKSLVQACKQTNVKKIIFSSTGSVYGEVQKHEPISEDLTPKPINPYAQSKFEAEKSLITAASEKQIQVIILRYFNAVGASLDGKNGQRTKTPYHILHKICLAALGKADSVNIYGNNYDTTDGSCVRDYIHVEDLAKLHILALDKNANNKNNYEIYNCGYGRGYSVQEIIQTVKKISNTDFRVSIQPRRKGDPSYLVANTDKMKKEFLWEPSHDDLELICKSALQFESQRK